MREYTLALLAMLTFVAGCAQVIGADEYKVGGGVGVGAGSGGGPCAPQVGSYRLHLAERPGGGCRPIQDSIAGLNTTGGTVVPVPDNCTGSDTFSANKCTEAMQLDCVLMNGNHQIDGRRHRLYR